MNAMGSREIVGELENGELGKLKHANLILTSWTLNN
jgi:hypothetical protein